MMNAKRAMLIVSVALLGACTMPYRTPVIVSKDGAEPKFAGLADLLEQSHTVDLLVIHGMCTHNAQWATQAVQSVYAALGGNPQVVKLDENRVEGTAVSLFQQTLQANGRELRANAILWSPVVADLKSQLCYDQSDKTNACASSPAYRYQRAAFNRQLKDQLLDDCLADALIYQGRAREEISGQIQKAVLQAIATSGGRQSAGDVVVSAANASTSVPVAVVTSSLGSKVIFDAIYKLSTKAETAKAGERIVRRTSQIFMEANQMPILGLADQGLDATKSLTQEAVAGGYPADPLNALVASMRVLGLEDTWAMPSVVSFTDPNDLLSYVLGPSQHAQQAAYPITDVIVSNDRTYFGFVENPLAAHVTYGDNDAVKHLIACGYPQSKLCR